MRLVRSNETQSLTWQGSFQHAVYIVLDSVYNLILFSHVRICIDGFEHRGRRSPLKTYEYTVQFGLFKYRTN